MTYRLLALDLDGTLLDRRMAISPEVRVAVAAAQQRGVLVTIATGRTFHATMPYIEALDIRDPVICYQGGAIFDSRTGAMSDAVTMSGALAAEVVRSMLETDLFCLVYADEKLYIAERRAELDFYLTFHPEGVDLVVEPELAALTETLRPLKVQFTAEPALVDRMLPLLEQRFAGRLSALRAHDHFGEFTPLGISKGNALARLATSLGIPREQVIAIGDHENDVQMIEWAGLGLAMGNAIPLAVAAADATIPSVEENGVAWAIERYILR